MNNMVTVSEATKKHLQTQKGFDVATKINQIIYNELSILDDYQAVLVCNEIEWYVKFQEDAIRLSHWKKK